MFLFAGAFDFSVFIVFEFWAGKIPATSYEQWAPKQHRNESWLFVAIPFGCRRNSQYSCWIHVHWIHNNEIVKRFRTSSHGNPASNTYARWWTKKGFCADFISVDHFIVSRLLFIPSFFSIHVIRFFSALDCSAEGPKSIRDEHLLIRYC